jgi:hypothetical protein
MSSSSASELLSQINELLEKLARLNSNVELYRQVRSLEEDLNALEQKYESFQNNIKTSTCNAQCKKLNKTIETNSVEEFLVQLLLSKSKSNPPPPTVPQDVKPAPPIPITDYQSSFLTQASAPYIPNINDGQASAPYINDGQASVPYINDGQASAPYINDL